MSYLEEALRENTAAVNRLIDLLSRAQSPVEAPTPKVEETKPAAKEPDHEPKVETPPKATTAEAEPPAPPAAVTYDDVKRATNALAKAKGASEVIALLAQFKVDHAKKLTDSQWGEYVARAEELSK